MTPPEVWLRGPVEGVAPLLQPAAHALLQILEEMERTLPSLGAEEVWATPGGAPSVGFHARHLAGSTDRLLTYARGEALSAAQRAHLAEEGVRLTPAPDGAALMAEVRSTLEEALAELRAWSRRSDELSAAREVGRARLPSTVFGLLFHAAEHAQRHAGQIATTVRVLREGRTNSDQEPDGIG